MDAKPGRWGRRVDSRVARTWLSVVVLTLFCATAGPAWASFPGRNGAIVYGWQYANKYMGSPTSISVVDPRNGRVRVLRDCPLVRYGYPDCSVSEPRYSPDGLRIAFTGVQYPLGDRWRSRPLLAIMASDGTGLEERPSTKSYDRLAWSPAGDQFLLESWLGGSGGGWATFLGLLDGTEVRQLTRVSPETQQPDWSSAGQIAFTRFRDRCNLRCSDIYVTRLGDSKPRLTYRGGSNPSWSPQGTKLAFVRDVGPRQADVFLLRRNGRGLRRLTHRGGHSPAWSPDGKWIAFIRAGDLHVVRTDGRSRRRLVDVDGLDEDLLGEEVTSVDWQALPPASPIARGQGRQAGVGEMTGRAGRRHGPAASPAGRRHRATCAARERRLTLGRKRARRTA